MPCQTCLSVIALSEFDLRESVLFERFLLYLASAIDQYTGELTVHVSLLVYFAVPTCTLEKRVVTITVRTSGLLSIPNVPDRQAISKCTWRLTVPKKFRLKVTIVALSLHNPNDYVIIRDGINETSELIGSYGPCAKGSVTVYSSGRDCLVQTVLHSQGWKGSLKIKLRPVHKGEKLVRV